MSSDVNMWKPRAFKPGVTYVTEVMSNVVNDWEEIIFLVIEQGDPFWHPDPIQCWALNLFTGKHFRFHRLSIIARNAKELTL